MYQVYILKLENDKYFVGYTKDISKIKESIKDFEWIQRHPLIKILKIIYNCDKYDVDKYTKKFMELYGIDNVRGGTYYHADLSQETLNSLKQELEILNKQIYIKSQEEDFIHKDDDTYFDEVENEFEIINKCARCGSNDHHTYDCYVEHIGNGKIKRCTNCKDYGHLAKECPITPQLKILERLNKYDQKIKKKIQQLNDYL